MTASIISTAIVLAIVAAILFWPEEKKDETPRCASCGRILWRDRAGNQRCAQRTDEVTEHRQLSEPKRKQIHQTIAQIQKARKETQ